MLDVLIKGAVVIDGTGAPGYRGTIGVKDGKIVLNPALYEAKNVIDANGLYLCPGFIDAHSHGDMVLGQDYAMLCKVSQGITTEIAGQCGTSMFPVVPGQEEGLKGILSVGALSFPDEFSDYTSFEKYASYVDKDGPRRYGLLNESLKC